MKERQRESYDAIKMKIGGGEACLMWENERVFLMGENMGVRVRGREIVSKSERV